MTAGELLKQLQGTDPKMEVHIFSSEDIPMYDCEEITDYEIRDVFEGSTVFCIKVKKGRSRIEE